MNKFSTLLACLVVSSATFAATSNATSSFDKDPDILLASNDKTWSYAAYNPNGLANVREFHDMGKSGVQQRGCTEFCVNGLMAGNRRISRIGYDLKHKESSTQRPH